MRRQVTIESLGRVYRQFSRQRYNKYCCQFPRLREAEVVAKIIKEWERMSVDQKKALGSLYLERKYIAEESDPQSHSSPTPLHKTPNKQEKNLSNLLTTDKSKHHAMSMKAPPKFNKFEDDEELCRYSSRLSDQGRQQHSSYSLELMPSAGKQPLLDKRPKQVDYIHFYKHYYKKLSREHRKWGAAKITNIIKLLWKRKRNATKPKNIKAKATLSKVKTIRKVSGWVLFKKQKIREGLNNRMARLKWKEQPLEKKKDYQRQGEGSYHSSAAIYRNSTVRFGNQVQNKSANLDFLKGNEDLHYLYSH